MAHTALIIDDDEKMRGLITDILEPFGFTVNTAATAEEGLQSASDHRPDVILCDLILPDGLGSDIARQLKQRPEMENVPIILVTGYPYLEKALQNLNCTLVTKPFSMTRMVEMVREAVGINSEIIA